MKDFCNSMLAKLGKTGHKNGLVSDKPAQCCSVVVVLSCVVLCCVVCWFAVGLRSFGCMIVMCMPTWYGLTAAEQQ